MKAFVIDVARCNGCYCCQIACKDEHVGNEWAPYSKPQPDTGQFWLRLNEFVRGTVPKVKMHYIPVLCMHCDKAPCIPACPVQEAIYKRDDGLVIIDPTKCTGCKACVAACPYTAIYFNEDLNVAQKCTGCAHLLDEGRKEPRCADACPTQALRFCEESELGDMIKEAELLHPEYDVKPRGYYLNIPKKFVAGTVYDPIENEVVIGAALTLCDLDNSEKFTAITDSFGDFWFEGLKAGTYSLKIEKNGKTKKMDSITTQDKDVNLGEIPFP